MFKKSLLMISVSAFLLYAPPTLSQAYKIKDGDSFLLEDTHIRLWGIDAPEYDQYCNLNDTPYPCGQHSRLALEQILATSDIVCEENYKDRYSRSVSKCFANGQDIAAIMVQSGYAFDYPRYSNGYYQVNQKEAQKQKAGLWAGQFDLPWKYNKASKY